jgi:hypothetical protein
MSDDMAEYVISDTIRSVLVTASNCSAPQEEYSELMAAADSFIYKITEMPLYQAMIDHRRTHQSEIPATFLSKLHLMGGIPLFMMSGPLVHLSCPRAEFERFAHFQLFADDHYDGLALLYGLSAFYRHLEQLGCRGSPQASLLRTAASISFLFFNEDMLQSEAYLTNNFFQARVGREDIAEALTSLRAIYPQVSAASKVALLKYAGALRVGFTSSEGTTGALIWEIRKILMRDDPEVSAGFLAQVSDIITETAMRIKRPPRPTPFPAPVQEPIPVSNSVSDVEGAVASELESVPASNLS